MYTCQRCDGEGYLKEHRHVEGGVCFKCNGTGKQATKPRKPKAPSKPKPEILAENTRKMNIAIEMYRNDDRAGVSPTNQHFYMHAIELAKKDGVWDTL